MTLIAVILSLNLANAKEHSDCQPRAEQKRSVIENCLGQPVKSVEITDDRSLKFDIAWYSSGRKDQLKYFRVVYDPSKNGISCDAGLEASLKVPAKNDYSCYPGTGKDGKDFEP